jgi:hypothetical protein
VKPVQRIESKGSVWLIDEDKMVYLRMPKTEGPREMLPWYSSSPALEDLKWLPYREWKFEENLAGQTVLRIFPPGSLGGIKAPMP